MQTCVIFYLVLDSPPNTPLALRLPSGIRHPKRICSGIAGSSHSSSESHPSSPVILSSRNFPSLSACYSSSCAGFSTISELRSSRASFRRNSSLLAEFDSSALKFSSALSFKNPSAFHQCWRQARSQMHGWGLFANEYIPPGQRIMEYVFS